MADVSIAGLSKRFGDFEALRDIDLHVAAGEFLAVLGPSGCGKTTLLRLLAGFERVSAGSIRFGAQVQAGDGVHVPPERRGIGMVFQSYALWPHMSVAENVGYPLRVRGTPRPEASRRVEAALRQVGLEALAARRPAALSGGQRQRVALARCLVAEPAVVLFDEPLANLDVHLRETMQAEFRAFHRDTGATMMYVTHDQAEAMALADRIAVLDAGVLQQVAAPRTLYAEPATAMVARFVGRGLLAPVEVLGADGDGHCQALLRGVPLRLRAADRRPGRATVCLRPESLTLASPGAETLAGQVEEVIYRGPVSTVAVRLDGEPALTLLVDTAALPPAEGSRAGISVHDGWCFREAVAP